MRVSNAAPPLHTLGTKNWANTARPALTAKIAGSGWRGASGSSCQNTRHPLSLSHYECPKRCAPFHAVPRDRGIFFVLPTPPHTDCVVQKESHCVVATHLLTVASLRIRASGGSWSRVSLWRRSAVARGEHPRLGVPAIRHAVLLVPRRVCCFSLLRAVGLQGSNFLSQKLTLQLSG
jgi:hypothetical protein